MLRRLRWGIVLRIGNELALGRFESENGRLELHNFCLEALDGRIQTDNLLRAGLGQCALLS